MATAQEREKILKRIINLLNKIEDNGCTEQEALAASELANRLMTQYEISAAECQENGRESYGEREEVGIGYNASPLDMVVAGVSKFTDTKSWFSKYRKTRRVVFFGAKHDVAGVFCRTNEPIKEKSHGRENETTAG